MKKLLFLIWISTSSLNSIAQSDSTTNNEKTVTLTVVGQGKTIEDARISALRSAIEQAFGAFISAKTEILNDKLINDEITSISNGNVQKYHILSEIQLPDGNYSCQIKASVSVQKLTSFCISKGMNVEFQGGLFAQNIRIQILNKSNELTAWNNFKSVIDKTAERLFHKKINVGKPQLVANDSIFNVPINIEINFNENFQNYLQNLYSFVESISMKENEVFEYLSTNKDVYPIVICFNNNLYGCFYFRNKLVQDELYMLPSYLVKKAINSLVVNNSLSQYSIKEFINSKEGNKINIIDKNTETEGAHPYHLYGFFTNRCNFLSFGLFGESPSIQIEKNGKVYLTNGKHGVYRDFDFENPIFPGIPQLDGAEGGPNWYLNICKYMQGSGEMNLLNFKLFGFLNNLKTISIPNESFKNSKAYLSYAGYYYNKAFLKIDYFESHTLHDIEKISDFSIK